MDVDWYSHLDESVGTVLLDSETIQRRVHELGSEITRDYRDRNPHLIVILKGACIFFSDLIRSIDVGVSTDFIAVGSYGSSTESIGAVRFLKDLDDSIEGKEVLVVEDILDTGLTLHYLLQNLESRNPRSLKVVVLLNKPDRRKIRVPVHYVGFEIPDRFVVGYGLDYNQRYRNLPDIRVLSLGAAQSP